MLTSLGILIEIIGGCIIFVAQIKFAYNTRKIYGKVSSIKKAFLDMIYGRFHPGKEKLMKMTKEEVDEALEIYPFSKLLVEDFKVSTIGLGLTIIGNLLQFARAN